MSQPALLLDTNRVMRLTSAQIKAWLGFSVLALLVSVPFAKAVFLGAAVATIGNLFFLFMAFRYAGAQAARQVLQSFYLGESGKFILTALLFAAMFYWIKPLSIVGVMMGFIAMQLVSAVSAYYDRT